MTQVWVNGREQDTVSVYDRGLSYGDGLFETILIREGEPVLLDDHLARLRRGLSRLCFPDDCISQLLQDLTSIEFTGDQSLKITVTRGRGERGYRAPDKPLCNRIITLAPLSDFSEQAKKGVKLTTCEQRLAINPSLAGIKHLNRLEQVLARNEWQQQYADGIMLDSEGFVVECTMSNIFWCADNKIFTPAIDRCGIEGIMRNYIIELLKQQKFAVIEGRFKPEHIRQASELFITNSLIELWPVTQLNGQPYPIGPIYHQIRNSLYGA